MTSTIETVEGLRRRVKIEVPLEEVNTERARILAQYARHARLPGFRPGKAPADMVARQFAEQIRNETRDELLRKSFAEVVRKESLQLATDPAVENVSFEDGSPLVFSALVDLQPELKLPEYKGIAVSATKVEVTDADVDAALKDLQDREATFTEVTDRALATGDYAILDFTSTIDGKPLVEVAPAARVLSESKGFWYEIGDERFLPEFAAVLPGLQIGDSTTIEVNFPEDHYVEPLRSQKAVFQVSVKGLRTKQVPELNDELAQRAAKMTLEELRARVREGLLARRQAEADAARREEVVNKLLAATEFDIPQSVLANYTRSVAREIIMENRARGVAAETLETDKDEIAAAAASAGRNRAKLRYLLLEIAKAEKFTASSDDMLAEVNRLATRADMEPRRVFKEIQKNQQFDALDEDIRAAKALDFIVANAKVTE
jgi:trigger factor